jgi:hypothetical protein
MPLTYRVTARVAHVSRLALLAVLVSPAFGCADAKPPAAAALDPAAVIDGDPLALLPAGPVALGNLDARAFYTSGTTAGQLAAFAEATFPLGQEAGFSAARDVDHAFLAVYAGASVDGVAILSGRFDVAKMQALAASHAATRLGPPCVALPYAGRTLFTVSNFAFSPLTDRTMIAGSEGAVRRVLDRLALAGPQPHLVREVALVADVAAIPPAAFHGFPLPPAMSGLSRLATIGDFNPPGINVASTLSYSDPSRAAVGAEGLRQLASFVTIAGNLGAGPKVQNLSIVPEGANVGCKFALDDEAMRRTLATLSKLFARPGG